MSSMTLPSLLLERTDRSCSKVLGQKQYGQLYMMSLPNDIEQIVMADRQTYQRKLEENGIKVAADTIEHETQEPCDLKIRKIQRGGSLVTYHVTIGQYSVDVVMLNINHIAGTVSRNKIAEGTFGKIIEIRGQSELYVAKRVYFRDTTCVLEERYDGVDWKLQGSHQEVRQFIMEYTFARICSAIGISAKVGHLPIFDIVCYRDCIQYYMERCQPVQPRLRSHQEFKNRMVFCMRTLHLLRIAHKDIKPANIVWSPSCEDFVLVDFGISGYISSLNGSRSLTFREGTPKYMSKEMRSLEYNKKGYVNLYWNDFCGLQVTFEDVKKYKKMEKADNMQVQQVQQPAVSSIEEDILLEGLFLHCKSQNSQVRINLQSELCKRLLPYFSDYLLERTLTRIESAKHELGIATNLQFLALAVGMKDMLYYLSLFRQPDYRVALITTKIIRVLLKSSDLPEWMNAAHSQQAVQLMKRSLQEIEQFPNRDSEENLKKRIGLTLEIAQRHLKWKKWKELADTLQNACQLFLLAKNTQKVLYVKWLMELFRRPNQLPQCTNELFHGRLNKQQRGLILLAMQCCIADHTQTAWRLSKLILNRIPNLNQPPSQIPQLLVSSLRELTFKLPTWSEEWTIVMSWLLESLRLRYPYTIINQCTELLANSPTKPSYSKIMVYRHLANAYQNANDFADSVRCYEKVRQYCQMLCLPIDRFLHIEVKDTIVGLNTRLNNTEEVLIGSRQVLKLIDGRREYGLYTVLARQRIYKCLVTLGMLDEAQLAFDEIILCLMEADMRIKQIRQFLYVVATDIMPTLSVTAKLSHLQQFLKLIKGLDAPNDIKQLTKRGSSFLGLAVVSVAQNYSDFANEVIQSALMTTLEFHLGQQTTESAATKQKQVDWLTSYPVRTFLENPSEPIKHCWELIANHQQLLVQHFLALLYHYCLRRQSEEVELLLQTIFELPHLLKVVDESRPYRQAIMKISSWSKHQWREDVGRKIAITQLSVSTQNHAEWEGFMYQLGWYRDAAELYVGVEIPGDSLELAMKYLKLAKEENIAKIPQEAAYYILLTKKLLLRGLNEHGEGEKRAQILLQLGNCEMKLVNWEAALSWFKNLLPKQPSKRIEDFERQAAVLFGMCLNKLKRYKHAPRYLHLARKQEGTLGVEGLFYHCHSLFVLRRRRQFKKAIANLIVSDTDSEYTEYLKNFLQEKSQKDYLVLYRETANINDGNPLKLLLSTQCEDSELNRRSLFRTISLGKKMSMFLSLKQKKAKQMGRAQNKESEILNALKTNVWRLAKKAI